MSRLLFVALIVFAGLLVCWLIVGNGARSQPDRLSANQPFRFSDPLRVGRPNQWAKKISWAQDVQPALSLTERQNAMSASKAVARDGQRRATNTYLVMRNKTLDQLSGEFSMSVYAHSSELLMGINQPKLAVMPVAFDIELDPQSYTDFPDPPASNAKLFPSRGFPRSLNDQDTELAAKPLITYETAGQESNILGMLPIGRVRSLSCSRRAGRSWYGRGRLSNRDYVEPFVVCEGDDRFSIAVDWRTSDVCARTGKFSLPGPIAEVTVVRPARGEETISGRAGSKDRLSIQTTGGDRMLVSCENANWNVMLAGTTNWQ